MFDSKQFAQDAAESTPAIYGKLSVGQTYKIFNGKGVPPTEVTRAEYDQANPKNRAIEVTFAVDTTEFNPNASFKYSRRVRLGSKDWRKTVAPSLIAVFGSLENLREGAYVQVEDVPQIEDPKFNAPKFVHVFGSAQECAAAMKLTDKTKSVATSIPDDALANARSVWKALSQNEALFRDVASKDPTLSKYDVDSLLAAARS